ncbi:resolvase [Mycobacterium avium 10-5560]|nr:resolvase [Mycobacterium avium 10-5560]
MVSTAAPLARRPRTAETGAGSILADVGVRAIGLSDRRAGLRKALSECMKPGTGRLLVEHPDRLARFGVGVIEHLLAGFGVTVVYTGQTEDQSAESELVRDMLAIVTSFAGRLYGQRSAKTKRLRAVVTAETTTIDGVQRDNQETP